MMRNDLYLYQHLYLYLHLHFISIISVCMKQTNVYILNSDFQQGKTMFLGNTWLSRRRRCSWHGEGRGQRLSSTSCRRRTTPRYKELSRSQGPHARFEKTWSREIFRKMGSPGFSPQLSTIHFLFLFSENIPLSKVHSSFLLNLI